MEDEPKNGKYVVRFINGKWQAISSTSENVWFQQLSRERQIETLKAEEKAFEERLETTRKKLKELGGN